MLIVQTFAHAATVLPPRETLALSTKATSAQVAIKGIGLIIAPVSYVLPVRRLVLGVLNALIVTMGLTKINQGSLLVNPRLSATLLCNRVLLVESQTDYPHQLMPEIAQQ